MRKYADRIELLYLSFINRYDVSCVNRRVLHANFHTHPPLILFSQDKRVRSYRLALSKVLVDSDSYLDLISFCCDYEQGLLQALQDEFPDAQHEGCNIHWKQALRKKMQELGVPTVNIHYIFTLSIYP